MTIKNTQNNTQLQVYCKIFIIAMYLGLIMIYNLYNYNPEDTFPGQRLINPKGEPRLELGVHVFGIMCNYFGVY